MDIVHKQFSLVHHVPSSESFQAYHQNISITPHIYAIISRRPAALRRYDRLLSYFGYVQLWLMAVHEAE
jgi:hypothetical protein